MRGGAGVERSTRRSRPVIAAVGEGDVGDAAANTPAVSRCRAHAFDACGRDQPVRRLEAGDAAERRRPDRRTRGLAGERDRHHAARRSQRRTRTMNRPAVGQVVRIARHRRHHGRSEFRSSRLAEDDAAGPADISDHRGSIGAGGPGIDRRAVFGRKIDGVRRCPCPATARPPQRRRRQAWRCPPPPAAPRSRSKHAKVADLDAHAPRSPRRRGRRRRAACDSPASMR